jgi:hypothetical protein
MTERDRPISTSRYTFVDSGRRPPVKRLLISSVVAAALVTIPASALADAPTHADCWGVVTSQRAVSEGDLGQHASA